MKHYYTLTICAGKHVLTQYNTPDEMAKNGQEVLANLLAKSSNPDSNVLFIQSDSPVTVVSAPLPTEKEKEEAKTNPITLNIFCPYTPEEFNKMNPMDKCDAICNMKKVGGYSMQEIANHYKIDIRTTHQLFALRHLAPGDQSALRTGKINLYQARKIIQS